jgi:hypothetical protein
LFIIIALTQLPQFVSAKCDIRVFAPAIPRLHRLRRARSISIRQRKFRRWFRRGGNATGTGFALRISGAAADTPNIMDKFSPEFAQHWFAGRSSAFDTAAVERRGDETLSPSQQEALEALADRVSAARCVF